MRNYGSELLLSEGPFTEGVDSGFIAGTRRVSEARRREWEDRLLRFEEALDDLARGRFSAEVFLRETYSTGDFTYLMGDTLDRQLLAHYNEYPADWRQFTNISTLRDFRTAKRVSFGGGDSQLGTVAELQNYPANTDLADSQYTITPVKYGRTYPLSFEALLNDDLNAFQQLPARMAMAARRTELKEITKLFADSSGPHASVYATANKNQVNTTNGAASNNPAFSITGLADAFTVLGKMLDPTTSEPIFIEAVTLVVPPSLEVSARNVLNATEIRMTNQGGASGQEINAQNWMRNRLTLVVNPYLPIVSTTNGGTSWYLFANANSGRPALQMGYIRGAMEPQLFRKAPDTIRVSGGSFGVDDGSFQNDTTEWKIRHVFGQAVMDPRYTVASNGSGS